MKRMVLPNRGKNNNYVVKNLSERDYIPKQPQNGSDVKVQRTFLLLFILSLSIFLQANEYIVNEKEYNNNTVADLITIITTTNPTPSMPSTKCLRDTQKSLFRIPAFQLCKKIIVFDGIQPGYESRVDDYEQYKKNVTELTINDPLFFQHRIGLLS